MFSRSPFRCSDFPIHDVRADGLVRRTQVSAGLWRVTSAVLS